MAIPRCLQFRRWKAAQHGDSLASLQQQQVLGFELCNRPFIRAYLLVDVRKNSQEILFNPCRVNIFRNNLMLAATCLLSACCVVAVIFLVLAAQVNA